MSGFNLNTSESKLAGMRFVLALFLTIISSALPGSTPGVVAEDWWRFRGPDATGISSETEWTHQWGSEGPQVDWRRELGVGFSAIVTRGGRLYTMGNQENVDTVYCLNAVTGETLWTHSYSSPTDPNEFEGGPTSTPTVDEDHVYSLSRGGDGFAFDRSTGKVIWSLNVSQVAGVRVPGWGFAGSPQVVDQTLVLNVGDAGVGLNKSTGEILWASADKEAGYSSPVPVEVGKTRCVILGSSRSYVCVEAATGREVWRERWLTTFGCNAADAIVSGGKVFLSSGYNRGSALLDTSGEQPETIWKHKDFQNQLSTSLLIDGFLYGASGDVDAGTALVCMEFATGRIAWREASIRPGGLTAAGNRLIVLTDSGEVVMLLADPDQFTPLARHQLLSGKCWTAPVLSHGRLYCRSAEGQLVCVNLSPSPE